LSRLISVLYFILIFRDSGIATYVAVYWWWWSRWSNCISRDRAFSLNCQFVLFTCFCKFFVSMNVWFSWAEQFFWKHPPHFNNAPLSLPVSEPHTT
jgi:hypothetical protein